MAALLQAAKEFSEALHLGVTSSFDDNGLAPLPAKVREAVESNMELKALASRAQGEGSHVCSVTESCMHTAFNIV